MTPFLAHSTPFRSHRSLSKVSTNSGEAHNGRGGAQLSTERSATFWEFPIRTLYREFPESRASLTPKPLPTRGRQGQGSGSELQELAGGALDFETLIVVRD